MILAEIENPVTQYARLETFRYMGEANKWVDFVLDSDIAFKHADKEALKIRFQDIGSGGMMAEHDYRTWK